MVPELHFTDGLLSLISAGGFVFVLWSVKQFRKLEISITDARDHTIRLFNKANKKGAKRVEKKFELLQAQIERIKFPGLPS